MSFWKKLFGRKEEDRPADIPAEVEKVLKVLDASLKKASLAEVGGFRPPDDPLSSWFGGRAVALPSEEIPEFEEEPMFPLLQVNCSELPYVPPELEGTALFVVWFTQKDWGPMLAEGRHKEGFVIREYKSLDGLAPVESINKPKDLKTFPIRWSMVEDDAPDWSDAWQITNLDPLLEFDEDYMLGPYDKRYTNYDRTKIGGYPTAIQYGLSEADVKGTFVFQIAAEPKANWDWVDNGVAYFLKDESGEWAWDCQFS